eukprot:COSAG01_NODE_3246_length_6357_cov_4.131831_6_plen_72_part_00
MDAAQSSAVSQLALEQERELHGVKVAACEERAASLGSQLTEARELLGTSKTQLAEARAEVSGPLRPFWRPF